MGAYKYLNNFVVNLVQAKELSLRRQGSLAQAKSFRLSLSEIENKQHFEFSLKLAHLAQARGLCSNEHLKPKGGVLLPFSLRRELLAQARASRLGEKQLAQASITDLTCSHACKAKNPSRNNTQIIFTPSKAHQIIKSTQQNQNRHIIYKSIKKSQLPLLGKSQPKDSYSKTVSTTALGTTY